MSASFRIVGHKTTGLLDVTLGGLFEYGDIQRLQTALIDEVGRLGCAPGTHRSIYDIRDCKIQSQDVVQRLRKLSDRPGRVACKLAIVVGPSLMRMQLRRIIGEERAMQTFDDRPAALSWVLGIA